MTDFVKIVEVGPRDGLQNEKIPLTLDDRKNLILDLMKTGLQSIEVGSCVSAKWVPQMADSDALFASLPQDPNIQDRKSTRLNSSHVRISYAVFCLKKK